MKLERAIPFLADRFADEDSWACEEAYRALEMIGTDSVVQELARRNVSGDWGLRFAVATTLEKIHSDLSVQTCQELLAQEPDESVQGLLLKAVLMNFCPDGI
jgi:HEAT repeat protein